MGMPRHCVAAGPEELRFFEENAVRDLQGEIVLNTGAYDSVCALNYYFPFGVAAL